MSNKPLPQATAVSKPFWDALREHRVTIQLCGDCESWVFYPRSNCPHCLSANLRWEEIEGKGEIYSYTIARVPTLPEFADEAPQLLAVIQLDQGPRLNSTLVGIEPEQIRVGMRVKPVFDDQDQVTLLRFTQDA
ncbi:hypothetical protein D3C78_288810 [compost metagenome]|jgi:uncharacterized OB-fold protein